MILKLNDVLTCKLASCAPPCTRGPGAVGRWRPWGSHRTAARRGSPPRPPRPPREDLKVQKRDN